jgi:membrane-bound lytic murein transglycosylase C
MKGAILIPVLATILSACTIHQAVDIATSGDDPVTAARRAAEGRIQAYARNPDLFKHDVQALAKAARTLIALLRGEVEPRWGEPEVRLPERRRYVKYSRGYLSRVIVEFDAGRVIVETLDEETAPDSLREALVVALLTPDDPRAVDLYSDEPVRLGGRPYLYGLVLDEAGRAIGDEAAARRFARQVVKQRMRSRIIQVDGRTRRLSYVEVAMVPGHTQRLARRYRPQVESQSKRFGLSRSLIYAVIKTESNFNPFAVSAAPAYGLMQLVPGSGGRDAWRRVKGRDGVPTPEYLFDPDNNIELGSAYLDLLASDYLRGIADPLSREYCAIAAYNTGAGNVLRVFDRDRSKALAVINALQPAQVYARLRQKLPHAETRRYLAKVVTARREFANLR